MGSGRPWWAAGEYKSLSEHHAWPVPVTLLIHSIQLSASYECIESKFRHSAIPCTFIIFQSPNSSHQFSWILIFHCTTIDEISDQEQRDANWNLRVQRLNKYCWDWLGNRPLLRPGIGIQNHSASMPLKNYQSKFIITLTNFLRENQRCL